MNWRIEKSALRSTLNSCIHNGCTYNQTKLVLGRHLNAICTKCFACGNAPCSRNRACFVENAYNTYLGVAQEKCAPEVTEENDG